MHIRRQFEKVYFMVKKSWHNNFRRLTKVPKSANLLTQDEKIGKGTTSELTPNAMKFKV